MISLTHLKLKEISSKHYNGVYTKTEKRFKKVRDYFKDLQRLAHRSSYPEAEITELVKDFKVSIQESLKPDKSNYNNHALHSDHQSILEALEEKLILTITGTPLQLDDFVENLKPVLIKYHSPDQKKFSYTDSFKPFITALKYVWDYDLFIGTDRKPSHWDAYQLADELKVAACPYCNRMYTITVILPEEENLSNAHLKITRPEFDHFYSKARYPFLGLAFFNLVPSCKICNSTLKGDKEMSIKTHCHPYVEGYENLLTFSTGIDVRDYMVGKPKIPINFQSNVGADEGAVKRANENLKIFRVHEIYPAHADIAEELFYKSTEDSKANIRGFWDQKSKHEHQLFDTKSDLYRHFVGNFYDPKSFYKRPMAKFHYDLLKEMKLVKFIEELPEKPDPSQAVNI